MGDTIFDKVPEHAHKENTFGPDQSNNCVKTFEEVVRSRRSVRVFDGTPIPKEVVRNCIRAALIAPNSSNLQPWEFYWITTAEKKIKAIEACLSQPAAKTADQLIAIVARTKTWNRNRKQMLEHFADAEKNGANIPASAKQYYEKLVPFMYTMGPFGVLGPIKKLLFTVAGLFRPTPREPTSKSGLILWAVKSTTLAAENLMLAFRAYGYDTCPMEGFDSARMKKILNLPRDAHVVMIIGAGKRATNGVYGPQIRFDESQFVFEV